MLIKQLTLTQLGVLIYYSSTSGFKPTLDSNLIQESFLDSLPSLVYALTILSSLKPSPHPILPRSSSPHSTPPTPIPHPPPRSRMGERLSRLSAFRIPLSNQEQDPRPNPTEILMITVPPASHPINKLNLPSHHHHHLSGSSTLDIHHHSRPPSSSCLDGGGFESKPSQDQDLLSMANLSESSLAHLQSQSWGTTPLKLSHQALIEEWPEIRTGKKIKLEPRGILLESQRPPRSRSMDSLDGLESYHPHDDGLKLKKSVPVLMELSEFLRNVSPVKPDWDVREESKSGWDDEGLRAPSSPGFYAQTALEEIKKLFPSLTRPTAPPGAIKKHPKFFNSSPSGSGSQDLHSHTDDHPLYQSLDSFRFGHQHHQVGSLIIDLDFYLFTISCFFLKAIQLSKKKKNPVMGEKQTKRKH